MLSEGSVGRLWTPDKIPMQLVVSVKYPYRITVSRKMSLYGIQA